MCDSLWRGFRNLHGCVSLAQGVATNPTLRHAPLHPADSLMAESIKHDLMWMNDCTRKAVSHRYSCSIIDVTLADEIHTGIWTETCIIILLLLLLSLRRYTSLLPFSFSLHVSDFTHSPIIERKILEIPKRSLRSVDDRSFSFIAPTVWNSLPAGLWNLPTLSDFKAQLRTFLFQQAFPQI